MSDLTFWLFVLPFMLLIWTVSVAVLVLVWGAAISAYRDMKEKRYGA